MTVPRVRNRPRNRRVAPADALRAVARVLIHIGVKHPDVLEDHGDDMRLLEAFASEILPPERELFSSSSVSSEGRDDEADDA